MKEGILWKITCIVVLLLGLLWGGCSLNDQWEAQALVTGEATKYTLVDDGRVLFTANDATGARNIVLEQNDIVIERPIADSVTVNTQLNRLQ
jgi:hypothetical protein